MTIHGDASIIIIIIITIILFFMPPDVIQVFLRHRTSAKKTIRKAFLCTREYFDNQQTCHALVVKQQKSQARSSLEN
jgi:hypothetical protein